MMRKILAYSLLVMAWATACRQEGEDALMGKPDERLAGVLEGYRQQLTGSAYGWEGFLFPGGGGGYSFLFEFSGEGRVTMMADINTACAAEPYESSFRLEAIQRPSLFFDTYSYIHILADPDPDTIGGATGHGLYSDFEFAFESATEDTIRLKGNRNDSELILIKATAEKAEAYRSGGLNVVMPAMAAYTKANPFLYLDPGDGKKISTGLNVDGKTFSLSYTEGNVLRQSVVPFGYTAAGIFLQEPLVYKDIRFREVFYDNTGDQLYIMAGGSRMYISVSASPVIPVHMLLGVDFSVISVPTEYILEGWSDHFLEDLRTVYSNLYFGSYQLQPELIEFEFDAERGALDINFYVSQNGTWFLARFPYTYAKNPNGIVTFSPDGTPKGNAALIAEDVTPIFEHLDEERFRMEYLQADDDLMVQLKSFETPEFYFSGYFGSAF